jgi:serine/threonine-protein kinase
MATLDNPNCVKVFDFFEEEGRAVLVSEYIRGASLRQVADREGYLTPEQSLGVLKGALSGLAYAHGRGLVHRDIKPDNLLADLEGVSKLADFGQALVNSGPGAAGGIPAGSPAYMSPEMVAGGRVDARSDIYSLGAMLFEFLTGRAPYTADSPLAVMRKHTNDPVPDPRSLNGNLPEGVALLVSRAMAKDPAERQRTADQFLDELEAAAVAGYGEDWEKRSSIKRAVAAAAAALGLLLVGQVGAAAATGATGEASTGGVNSGINKWLIAGGVAAVLVVGVAIFGLTHGNNGSNAGGVVIGTPSPTAAATPTPSDLPSPSPDASPSPTPSPTPSPSPSHSASPSVQPSTAPGGPVTVQRLTAWWQYCSTPSTCAAPQTGDSSSAGTCGTPAYFLFTEDYLYSYPGSSGPSVALDISWNVADQTVTGTQTYHDAHVSRTVGPGSARVSHTATTPYKFTAGSPGDIVTVNMQMTWTNPDGKKAQAAAAPLNLTCGGKP